MQLEFSKKKWIRLLLLVGLIIPFLLSFPAWFSTRDFPVIPLFFEPLKFSYYIDIALLVLFSAFSVWFLISEKGMGGLFFFILYVLYAILDQTRIQPFFFEISLIIFIYYLFRHNFERFKIGFLILMAGTYIWSGLHKANPVFYDLWLGGLDKRIPFIPKVLRQLFTMSVPFIEMSFGIALLFNSVRKLSILLLAIMHSMILITLFISGAGFLVFPINILNVLLLFMIGYRMDWSILRIKSLSSLKIKSIIIYALILPALNLIGLYDHLLSFSYFSGKPSYCNIIFLDESNIDKLPKNILAITRIYEAKHYINVNEWSVTHVKLLCYPEERVYEYLQDYIESFTGEDTTVLQYYKSND